MYNKALGIIFFSESSSSPMGWIYMPLLQLKWKITVICFFFLLPFHLGVAPLNFPSLLCLPHSYTCMRVQCKPSLSDFPSHCPSLRNITLLRNCRAAIICRIYLTINCVVSYAIFFFVVSACYLNTLLLVNFRHIYTLSKDTRLKFAKEICNIPLSPFVSSKGNRGTGHGFHLSIWQLILSTIQWGDWVITKMRWNICI